MSNNPYLHEEIQRSKALLTKASQLKICICGAGALGSLLTDTLTRQGFTQIKVIDFDRVESHNLNTQLYGFDDVGRLKIDALQNKIGRSAKVYIDIEQKKLQANNVGKLLKNYDLVVDAFDNTEARQLITDYCGQNKVNCLHGGMADSYSEIVWNEVYKVPKSNSGLDVCEYPMARNLVTITVSIMAEVIWEFLTNNKKLSKKFTLGDLRIGDYK